MKYTVDFLRSSGGSRRNLLAALNCLLGALVVPCSASAQTAFTLPAPPFELPFLPPASGNWTVMVGVGGEYGPNFEGSKNWMLSPIPIFSIRRVGSADPFRAPRDSSSIALIDFGDLRAGPAAKFVPERICSKYPERNGLSDVKAAVELGFASDPRFDRVWVVITAPSPTSLLILSCP